MSVEIPLRGPRIFISYSFSNRNVTAFEASLRARGWQPTVVQASTLLGEASLAGALRGLIEQSDYVVPLVDEAAVQSQWVREEIAIARQLAVPVVPVLEQGVAPSGPFSDIPCVTADMGLDAVAERVMRDYVALDIDPSYPAHIRADRWMEFMRGDRAPLVDADLTLSRTLAAVSDALIGIGHDGLTQQTERQWRRWNRFLREFEELLPTYRQMLQPFLEGYSEPERASITSWDALSRLFIGARVIELATTAPPDRQPAWGPLSDGVTRLLDEWEAIKEDDHTTKEWLWGVGRRQLPLARWSEDRDSPLGEWRLAAAFLADGSRHRVVVPDHPGISLGLHLREPPRRFLESWDWMNFLLPQLAYHGASLQPELGPDMLKWLVQA